MEKSVGINAFWLKIIAITGMIMQHTALALAEITPYWLQWPLNAAGGLTFPIMAFLLVEGFRHTSNMTKYIIRLLIFGLISQVPFMFMFQTNFQLNIMFTLLLGILILKLYDRIQKRDLFWLAFIGITIVSLAFNWGIFGPILVLMYRVIKSEKKRRTLPSFISGITQLIMGLLALGIFALISAPFFTEIIAKVPELAELTELFSTAGAIPVMIAFPLGMLAAIPLIRAYNGERGRSMKYLFYTAYPLHLAILAVIAIVLGFNDFRLFGIFGFGLG